MLPISSWNIILIIVFAIFFYRAGKFDDGPALLWTALSVAISLLIWFWLNWGLFAMFLGQVGLFVGIGVFRVIRKS